MTGSQVARRLVAAGTVTVALASCDGSEGVLVSFPGGTFGGAGGEEGGGGSALSSFRIQLTGRLDRTPADLVIVDFDALPEDLEALRDQGSRIACYFSAGTFEPWRRDASSFREELLGTELSRYPDERWLDVSSEEVATLMASRIREAAGRGCSSVYPVVVRPSEAETTGFATSAEAFRRYEGGLARVARVEGLGSIYAGESVFDVGAEPYDEAVIFGCQAARTCDSWADFAAEKPVYSVEIAASGVRPEDLCGPTPRAWPVVVKEEELGPFTHACAP